MESRKILRGAWITGQKLPSQRELSRLFEVNRSTVVMAMDELYAMGLLKGRSGSGTKITYNIWSSLVLSSIPDWKNYISGGIFKSNIPIIQQINQSEYDSSIIRFNAGEMAPELLPTELTKKIFAKLSQRNFSLSYPEPLGLLSLREALCEYLQAKGIYVTPKEILITSGAIQALYLISVCIIPPRSTIYVESPTYLKSLRIFQSAGSALAGIPMDSEGIMPWMINLKPDTRTTSILYSIPSFHNPTGNVMSDNRRQELIKFCQTHRLPVVEDDEFSDLWFDKQPPMPLKARDKNGIVLYVGSCSKVFSPGLRTGWLVGPESVIQRLADIKMQHDYGTSTVSQLVFSEALKSGDYFVYLSELRKKFIKKRDFMLQLLNQYFRDIATWEIPKGGFFIYLKFKRNINMDKIFNQAFQENILITPGTIYDFNETASIRLSFAAVSFTQMEEGLSKLANIIYRQLILKD